MRAFLLAIAFCLSVHAYAQNEPVTAITKVLNQQVSAWNRGDIERYMHGYWNNDSLVFIGKNGAKYGYNTTLENYRKSYPDTTAMGKLQFSNLSFRQLGGEHYFVIGKWHLTRTMGNLSGHFSLVFKLINGHWLIIADHSS